MNHKTFIQEFARWTHPLLVGLVVMGSASLIAGIATVTLYSMAEHAYTGHAGTCFRIFIFTTTSAISFAVMSSIALRIKDARKRRPKPEAARRQPETPL